MVSKLSGICNDFIIIKLNLGCKVKLIKYIYKTVKHKLIFALITTLQNAGLMAVINYKGAELVSFKDTENREYIWDADPKYWAKHSPILFPIVGTLKNNHYTYNGIQYTLSRHGFARDMNFELIEKTKNSATFSLISSDETKIMFPFDFELDLKYTLIENKLILAYTIINKGHIKMPFSIGAHPAFALPESFENYSLAFEHSEQLDCFPLENDLISELSYPIRLEENKLPLRYSLFEKDALIFKELKSKSISILDKGTPFLRLHLGNFKNLGIWTKDKAPFICIEPWLGYSDTKNSSGALLEKEGIQMLKAQDSFNCHFEIEIL